MWLVLLLLAVSSATAGQPEGGEEAALARLSPELRLMLNTSLYTTCRSRTGSQVPQFIIYCEAQARVRQGRARKDKGWPLRRKASKLKPLPRAYTKVHPPGSLKISVN